MNESEQDLQRRELIFKVLDELKDKEERINADKVARLAKMGKQTVLPYYKEWRFLDDVEREQKDEVPEELIRSLKRGIARWKHELATQAQTFEEHANSEIDQLKQTIQSLSDSQAEKEEHINQLKSERVETQNLLTEQITLGNEQKQSLAAIQAQLTSEQQKNTDLTHLLEQQKKENNQAATQLEQRLDLRHQEQMNHWLKVVDDERRFKQDIEKHLIQQKELQLKTEKEKNEISHRLDSKNRAYMDACEDRNQLKADCKILQPSHKILEQNVLLLDCDPEELTSRVRKLLTAEQHCITLSAQVDQQKLETASLTKTLSETEHKLSYTNDIEKQLEKTRGYIEAMEKTLATSDKKKEG